MIRIQNFNFIIWKFLQMSKFLYNILKISGEQMPQMPPWLDAWSLLSGLVLNSQWELSAKVYWLWRVFVIHLLSSFKPALYFNLSKLPIFLSIYSSTSHYLKPGVQCAFKKITILNSFQLILKENVKTVWERRSHTFPPHYTPAWNNFAGMSNFLVSPSLMLFWPLIILKLWLICRKCPKKSRLCMLWKERHFR